MRGAADRAFALKLGAIALVALAIRVVYVVVVDPDQLGIGDFYFYHDMANTLALGHGYTVPGSAVSGHAIPTAGKPPLWPEVLSLVSRLGGDGVPIGSRGVPGYESHRLAGGVVGVALVIAVGYLGRRAMSNHVGLTAAALAAVYPVLIAADASLMPETLFALCIAVAMLIAWRVLDGANFGWILALGVAIGVSSLARSEGLLLVPVLALPVIWRAAVPRRAAVAHTLLVCAGVAVAIAPWTIRNLVQFDRLVIGSTNDGSLISGANCDATYYGRGIGSWTVECVGPSGPNEVEAAARQRRQGVRYARHHAVRLPFVVAARLGRTWDVFQPWQGATLNEGRSVDMSRIGLVTYWLLLPLAVLGAVVVCRRRRPLRILLAPVFLVILTTALGWGTTRFREPAEISIVVLAAVAACAACDRMRERRSIGDATMARGAA